MVSWLHFWRTFRWKTSFQGKRLYYQNINFIDVDQLNQIIAILGTPDDATIGRIGSQRAQVYVRSLPKVKKVPWFQLFPKASDIGMFYFLNFFKR
jgi:hypothetical protein